MTLAELIAALEAADGPSRELDATIYKTINPYWLAIVDCVWTDDDGNRHPMNTVSHYTASIDAAVTLVPEGWTGLIPVDADGEAWLWPSGEMSIGVRLRAATPALAVCIAALKAREAKE